MGCGWSEFGLPFDEQPSNTTGSSQVASSGSSANDLDRAGFFAAEFQQAPSTLA
jgi:hypothetical protein